MSFLGGLGRLLTGKPVFQVPEADTVRRGQANGMDPEPTPGPQPVQPPQPIEPPRPHHKELPEARIRDWLECRIEGSNMTCELRLRNDSPVRLQLVKLEFLGNTRALGQSLQPGQEFEVVAYNGDRPHHPSHTEAKLYYKDETGDYFSTEHYVQMERLGDGTYKVARIQFREVRDE